MADKNLAGHKTVGGYFGNAVETIRVPYDFDADTGESDDDYMVITADGDLIILDYFLYGITEFDSAGDGTTVNVGIDGGDEDILLAAVAEATVAAGAVVPPTVVEGAPNVFALPLKLADGESIRMKFAVEDLTSGKAEHVFRLMKASDFE